MPIETPAGTLEVENAKFRASSVEATIAVGIGTDSNDAYPLQVFKETAPSIRLSEGSTISSAARLYSNNSNLYIQTGADFSSGSSGDVAFQTMGGQSTHMVIKSDGKVGVGTNSPDTNLHIYGDTNQTNIYLGEDGTTDKAGIIKYFQGNGSGTGTLHLGHWGDNFSSTQTLCIKKGGNVGIGVANPAVKLDVNGSASLRSQPCVIAYPSASAVYTGSTYQDIIFGGTLLNRGSMYNTSTGIITIPEDGVYYFHTHMYTESGVTGIFDLFKQPSGSSTWYRYTRGECNSGCGNNTLITLMSTQLCITGDKFKYRKNPNTPVEQILHSGTGQYFQIMACYKVG